MTTTVTKALSDERARELMNFMFGERLRKKRDAAGSAAPAAPALVVVAPSRKRKRSEVEWTIADELEEDERWWRRPAAPRWTPRWREVPLLDAPAWPEPTPAWWSDVRQITVKLGDRSTTWCSNSNERNAHARSPDSFFMGGFDFPNDHYYMIDWIRGGYISGTGFIHHGFFADFEAKRLTIARGCTNAKKPPYMGMTVDEVLAFWNKIRDTGTCRHAAIDDALQGRPQRTYQLGNSEAVNGPPLGFYAFLTDFNNLEIYFSEFTVFDRALVLVGQFDALFWDRTRQCFVLVDWKNTLNFRTTSSEKGTDPLTAHLPDCHYGHYSMQLNLYRALLERRYGFVIAEMWIVNFPALQSDVYQRFDVAYMDMEPFFARCPVTEEGRARLVWAPAEPQPPVILRRPL
jgi:hypothetical protein